MDFSQFLTIGFLQTGLGWAILGAMLALCLGGMGSSFGIGVAGMLGAGVLSEKPGLFGKVFLLILLPGTQGLYGLVFAFLLATNLGLSGPGGLKAAYALPPVVGMALCAVGLAVGVVLFVSAKYQGQTSAAAISLTARKEDQFGRALILPALIETYAVFALLVGILMINWLLPAQAASATAVPAVP